MKRLFLFLSVAFALMLVLIGCGEDGDNGDDKNQNEKAVKFTITWVDEKGNTVFEQSVEKDGIPSYTYTVTDTQEWDYTFIGWALNADGEVLSSIPKATSDTSYYAKVTATKQKYTVKFNSNGGSSVESQIVEYGSTATVPKAPEYEDHKFVGWATSPDGSEVADFNKPICDNIEYFAVWNEIVNVKSLLSALLSGYELNPLSYIPQTMLSNYSANLVEEENILQDYSSVVNISEITYGHGEQWNMILNNLEQTNIFFNVLSIVETLSTTSITAFNNYFDTNPQDTAHYTFESGIYNVTIDFNGDVISYVLDYSAEIPLLGFQTVQIALSMKIESGEKAVRIQLGDDNALSYKVFEDYYEFAIKYLGVRKAMFSVEREHNGDVNGKIYEFLTVSSAEIGSAAEFYITDNYVSVIGNKASGMLGFTGYICELYDVESGKMIGYEIQETLSSIVYNTLWFNLDTVSGINSVKYKTANGEEKAAFFINGSSEKWKSRNVGGLSAKMLSRRFDIEFRTQYVYSYDPVSKKYTEHKIEVPMFFVQEENYDTLIADVKSTNAIDISLVISASDYSKLLLDYDTLINSFIEYKDSTTPDVIIDIIGSKVSFT